MRCLYRAQVGKLKAEKEVLTRKSEDLAARANEAEKKRDELKLQLVKVSVLYLIVMLQMLFVLNPTILGHYT